MNIIEALHKSKNKDKEQRIDMPDGLLSISYGVFHATLFRLGQEPSDYIDTPLEMRGEILNDFERRIETETL